MLQNLKEYQHSRKYRRNRRKIRRRIAKNFIPLEGSWKKFFRDIGPDGQRVDYYLKRLWRDLRFTIHSTHNRMWYGQSSFSYYNLDTDLLKYLRNGLAMLSELTIGYNPTHCATYEDWVAELTKMRDYIDSFFSSEDIYRGEEYLQHISTWLKDNLTALWD